MIGKVYIHKSGYGWAVWKCTEETKVDVRLELIKNYTGRMGGFIMVKKYNLYTPCWGELSELEKAILL
jgi:hypothetical protein